MAEHESKIPEAAAAAAPYLPQERQTTAPADRLDAIEARVDAVAGGPWVCDGFADSGAVNLSIYESTNQGRVIAGGITRHADADLLLNARQDVQYLMALVRAQRAAVDTAYVESNEPLQGRPATALQDHLDAIEARAKNRPAYSFPHEAQEDRDYLLDLARKQRWVISMYEKSLL